MSRRTERIAELVRAEVARLLRAEVTDPRIGMLTLTRVDVAPDLSNARVFWSAFEGKEGIDLDEIASGLASAAPFLRKRLSAVMQTKRVPALRFEHDPSLAGGAQTLSLLAELSHESKE